MHKFLSSIFLAGLLAMNCVAMAAPAKPSVRPVTPVVHKAKVVRPELEASEKIDMKQTVKLDRRRNAIVAKCAYPVELNGGTNKLEFAIAKVYNLDKKHYNKGKHQYKPEMQLEINMQGTKAYKLGSSIMYAKVNNAELEDFYKTFKQRRNEKLERKAIAKQDKKLQEKQVARAQRVYHTMEISNVMIPEDKYAPKHTYFSKGTLSLDKYDHFLRILKSALANGNRIIVDVAFWEGGANQKIILNQRNLKNLQKLCEYDLYQDAKTLNRMPEAIQAPRDEKDLHFVRVGKR